MGSKSAHDHMAHRSRHRDRSASPNRHMLGNRSHEPYYSHPSLPPRPHPTKSISSEVTRSPPFRHSRRQPELRPQQDPGPGSPDGRDKRPKPPGVPEDCSQGAGMTKACGDQVDGAGQAIATRLPSTESVTKHRCSPSEGRLPTPSETSGSTTLTSAPVIAPAKGKTGLFINVPESHPPPETLSPDTYGQLDFITKMYQKKLVAASKRDTFHRTQCQVDNWELENIQKIWAELEQTKIELSESKMIIVKQQSEIETYKAAPTHAFLTKKTVTLEDQLGLKDQQIFELKVRLAAETVKKDLMAAEKEVLSQECADGRDVMQHYCTCRGWDRWAEAKRLDAESVQAKLE